MSALDISRQGDGMTENSLTVCWESQANSEIAKSWLIALLANALLDLVAKTYILERFLPAPPDPNKSRSQTYIPTGSYD
jgi:hypothetical protein